MNRSHNTYRDGQPANLLITGKTPLGYNAIVDNDRQGLLYHDNLANPLAVLLSANMLLEYVGEWKFPERIDRAVWDVLEKGEHRTGDLGRTADTDTFTNARLEAL